MKFKINDVLIVSLEEGVDALKFYQIIDITPTSIVCNEIDCKVIEWDELKGEGYCIPTLDDFITYHCIKSISLWDGKPVYFNYLD